MKIAKRELLNMSTDEIAKLTKRKFVGIHLNNGEIKDIYVKNLLGASNPPNLFYGFITSDDQTIYLPIIDYIELI